MDPEDPAGRPLPLPPDGGDVRVADPVRGAPAGGRRPWSASLDTDPDDTRPCSPDDDEVGRPDEADDEPEDEAEPVVLEPVEDAERGRA